LALFVGAGGELAVAGFFESPTIDLGGGSLSNANPPAEGFMGGGDLFVLKLGE